MTKTRGEDGGSYHGGGGVKGEGFGGGGATTGLQDGGTAGTDKPETLVLKLTKTGGDEYHQKRLGDVVDMGIKGTVIDTLT